MPDASRWNDRKESLKMELKDYIRDVPDFPKPGILFKDITPLLKNPAAFRHAIGLLAERYRKNLPDKIVGIESRGFIFAAALAYELGTGMVPVRKVGKLPAKTVKAHYDLEYGTDCVEIHEDAIDKGDRVLVIDDLIATGGTLAATCGLVELVGGKVIEAACIVDLSFLPWKEKMGSYPVFSLIQY